jgi:hypothetical protein
LAAICGSPCLLVSLGIGAAFGISVVADRSRLADRRLESDDAGLRRPPAAVVGWFRFRLFPAGSVDRFGLVDADKFVADACAVVAMPAGLALFWARVALARLFCRAGRGFSCLPSPSRRSNGCAAMC